MAQGIEEEERQRKKERKKERNSYTEFTEVGAQRAQRKTKVETGARRCKSPQKLEVAQFKNSNEFPVHSNF